MAALDGPEVCWCWRPVVGSVRLSRQQGLGSACCHWLLSVAVCAGGCSWPDRSLGWEGPLSSIRPSSPSKMHCCPVGDLLVNALLLLVLAATAHHLLGRGPGTRSVPGEAWGWATVPLALGAWTNGVPTASSTTAAWTWTCTMSRASTGGLAGWPWWAWAPARCLRTFRPCYRGNGAMRSNHHLYRRTGSGSPAGHRPPGGTRIWRVRPGYGAHGGGHLAPAAAASRRLTADLCERALRSVLLAVLAAHTARVPRLTCPETRGTRSAACRCVR